MNSEVITYVDECRRLTKKDTKKHVIHTFYIEEAMAYLEIIFTYTPKYESDRQKCWEIIDNEKDHYPIEIKKQLEQEEGLCLNNLLTISVDDPHGFRGNAHRHIIDKVIRISQDEASAGFIKGKIGTGAWRVVVSAHAILSDCVEYSIMVRGGY